jgi:hypothetical protein
MSKIQIKRYNGSTTTWENQFPITKAQNILKEDGTASIFDANDRVRIEHLPSAVFDSLYFFVTVGEEGSSLGTNLDVNQFFVNAINHAAVNNRSVKGYYFIAAYKSRLERYNNPSQVQSGEWIHQTFFQPDEERPFNGSIPYIILEPGDWFIITNVSGDGTQFNPYMVTFAVVNNTYELAATNAPGIVTLSNQTVWANLAGNNVVTDAKLKELVDGQFQPQLNTLADRVRVFYDGTPTGMVTDDIWFDAV